MTGDPGDAGDRSADLTNFHDADRRARVVEPRASDFALRADAAWALGFGALAGRDLDRVERDNLHGLEVLRWLMRRRRSAAARAEAASALLALDRAGAADVEAALTALFEAGHPLVLRAARDGDAVGGWVAWAGHGAPDIEVRCAGGRAFRAPAPVIEGTSIVGAVRRARFLFPADPAEAVEVRARLPSGPSRTATLHPDRPPPDDAAPVPARDVALTVIVPVFGDPDSLELCLAALRGEAAEGVAFVVVDDASPDARVAAVARAFCDGGRVTYIRAAINAGFAAAVNLALARTGRGDVLILNSDVILPPGALARLRSAAGSAPDIGTVSPLSNDAGEASFPDPLAPSPALSSSERDRVDAAARSANAGAVVDLLAALGSCLYVTRACLDRVGPLSLRYGRGYYEDVELYLRSIEVGLRNVAACDVYVSHLGGRSFGAARRALVSRNHDIIRQRFPGFERADAIFDVADPLRARRSAIEERLGAPDDIAALIVGPAVGSEDLIAHRVATRRARGDAVLTLRHAATAEGCEVSLAAPGRPWPRSLSFALGGTADASGRLVAYLAGVGRADMEILKPERLPASLGQALTRAGLQMVRAVESLDPARASKAMSEPGPGQGRAGMGPPPQPSGEDGLQGGLRDSPHLPVDRMAAAHLGPFAPPRRLARGGPPRGAAGARMLGIVAGPNSPAAEALALALARSMRERGRTRLLVLGPAIDEAQLTASGNVWVTGPLGADDPAEFARLYGVDALFSPHRTSASWCLDALQEALGVAAAYFDGSGSAVAGGPGDLVLEPSAPDLAVCARVAAWCADPADAA